MQIRNALVLGMARSGIAATKLLLSRGANVTIADMKTAAELDAALDELRVPGVEWRLSEPPEELLSGKDALILSPGVPITNPAVIRAEELGIPVLSELEYAYRESIGTLLAVTGTNGKTTTTMLLGEIFANAGRTVHVVGNIGSPYSAAVEKMRAGDVTVCEVSSFQLETVHEFHPAACCVLNISEDHLYRHGTMENYIRLKRRVFANCTKDDFVILNYDDLSVRAMAEHTAAKVVWFSKDTPFEYGAYVKNGTLVFASPDETRNVCAISEISLPGEHNLQNALAATAMASVAGIPAPVIRHTLRTFKGVEHRIESVRTLDGVEYINDSKATNVDSAICGVRAMDKPTVLILGGSWKQMDYAPLVAEIKKNPAIKRCLLIGFTAREIAEALKKGGYRAFELAGDDFESIIKRARDIASHGWAVLLSPACASFDMFKDYEHRGREFKRIVNALEKGGS